MEVFLPHSEMEKLGLIDAELQEKVNECVKIVNMLTKEEEKMTMMIMRGKK